MLGAKENWDRRLNNGFLFRINIKYYIMNNFVKGNKGNLSRLLGFRARNL